MNQFYVSIFLGNRLIKLKEKRYILYVFVFIKVCADSGHKRSPSTSIQCRYVYLFWPWDCRPHILYESRVPLNAGLGGRRDVSHEHTR